MKIDFLIIGQGLAGSLLAWELIQRNKKVIIIDNGTENASLMAAGLINPVTGMRFVKSTDVDHLLPTAKSYYQKLTDYFQQTFYIEKPLLRILTHQNQLKACQKRLRQSEYHPYIDSIIPNAPLVKTSFGILIQKQTGYLLTRPLLNALKQYFISSNAYFKTTMKYSDIEFTPYLHWKNFQPSHIIFCEGHSATNNPWFSWLPFQPVKGEIITANAPIKLPQTILNYGHWLIPLDSYQFRTGATFDRESLDTTITEKAKAKLLESLQHVCPDISAGNKIIQQAGIRPTTLDKLPFIGGHPVHPKLLIFNGFGAKGSLQIPWYCQCLANHLLKNAPIPSHSNILRFLDLYC